MNITDCSSVPLVAPVVLGISLIHYANDVLAPAPQFMVTLSVSVLAVMSCLMTPSPAVVKVMENLYLFLANIYFTNLMGKETALTNIYFKPPECYLWPCRDHTGIFSQRQRAPIFFERLTPWLINCISCWFNYTMMLGGCEDARLV